ncbi:MAG TPA: methyltransferase domain-containing protein [Microbacteriaceae bacterium]|nr:methyltransferase domain-containing protein [Microbacteriaceae bacterium]
MTAGFLAARDTVARERMDDPDCDSVMLERTYHRFAALNAVVSRERRRYRRWIRPRLRSDRATRLLDIGTGAADSLRRARAWAARDGFELAALGIDTDPRAIQYAATRSPGIELLATTSAELADAGRAFDLVVSNHLLHHLADGEVVALLNDSARLTAPGGVAVHSDIARSRGAYAAFAAVTWPLQAGPLRGTFIRDDGLVSIARSRTAAELAQLAPAGWDVARAAPSRVEVRRVAP